MVKFDVRKFDQTWSRACSLNPRSRLNDNEANSYAPIYTAKFQEVHLHFVCLTVHSSPIGKIYLYLHHPATLIARSCRVFLIVAAGDQNSRFAR